MFASTDEHVTWNLNPKYPKQKKGDQIKIVSNKKKQKRPSTSNYNEVAWIFEK